MNRAIVLLAFVGAAVAVLQMGDTPYNTSELATIQGYFQANVDVDGQGYVLASPSKNNPDYFYHWVRDGSLCMHYLRDTVTDTEWDRHMSNYVNWVDKILAQNDPNGVNIFGEPKFYTSGQVFDQPWARPQNDGPALRALVLIEYAYYLIANGRKSYVIDRLWQPNTFNGILKQNLEFVAHHWSDQSFDLWEETYGDHFFTKMVQRKSLVLGAKLGNFLGDSGAAVFYADQAGDMQGAIMKHFNYKNNVFMETLPPHGGPQKFQDLDTAVYLGILYGYANDSFLPVTDPKVWSTIAELEKVFTDGSFPINHYDDQRGLGGVLTGRYPNDTYNGYQTGTYGNPWHLTSQALAECYYTTARELVSSPDTHTELLPVLAKVLNHRRIQFTNTKEGIAQALVLTGDSILLRVKFHIQGGGLHMNEELNKDTGFQQGANDLSWSYATLFSALKVRDTITKM